MSQETFTTNIGACDPSDCASCTSDCSGAGQAIPRVPNPTIKLTLEDDSVLECAVLTTFDVEGFGEYIALIPLDKNGKNKNGETFLFRYHEENGNPVINNIEREDEYMAAADSFHSFIENLPHENEIDEELEEEPDEKQNEKQDEDIFVEDELEELGEELDKKQNKEQDEEQDEDIFAE